MASANLPDRTFPLVPHDISPVILRCRECRRNIPAGYPFVPIFAPVKGAQEMTAVLCVYCEGTADGAAAPAEG